MEKTLIDYLKSRQVKTKKMSESLASLEEQLHEANRVGNTRKSNSIKIIIKRIKNKKA